MWIFIKIDKRNQPLFKHPKHGLGILVEEGDYSPASGELAIKVRCFEGGKTVEGFTKVKITQGELVPFALPKRTKDGGWGTMHKTLAPWDRGWSKPRGPWPIECPYTDPAFVAAWAPSTGGRHRNVNAYRLVREVKDWTGWTVSSHSLRAPNGDTMPCAEDSFNRSSVRDYLLVQAPHLLNPDHKHWWLTARWGKDRAVVGAVVGDDELLLPIYDYKEDELLAGAAPTNLRFVSVTEDASGFEARAIDGQGRAYTLKATWSSSGARASGSYCSSTGEDDD